MNNQQGFSWILPVVVITVLVLAYLFFFRAPADDDPMFTQPGGGITNQIN